MNNKENALSGVLAEDRAKFFLEAKGLVTVQRNFRCKMGEIDLIMNHQGVLVFVEVRYRSSARYGGARESITETKRKRIERAAKLFLMRFAKVPACRFDVVILQEHHMPEWIQNVW